MKGRRESPRIMVISGDPGGARAMAPVVRELRKEARVHVDAYAYKQAHPLWQALMIMHSCLPDSLSFREAEEMFRIGEYELLLTSTSFGGSEFEKMFISLARERGIPSITLLDTWGNYSQRFSDGEGRIAFLPDRIAVIDERAYQEMVEEGFSPEHLVITGQPAFDDLHPRNQIPRGRNTLMLFGKYPVERDELLVLFASQPFSQIYGTDPSSPRYPGFDEGKVIRLLIPVLDSLSAERNRDISLIIRPHPREDSAAYRELKGERITVRVTSEGDSRDWILESDLVTGMNSILLVEACYLGVPVISLQPGLRGKDLLPMNQAGLSRAVYKAEEVKQAIEEVLFNTRVRERMISRLAEMPRDGHATRRVMGQVYSMTGIG
jgi:hypothetical protein